VTVPQGGKLTQVCCEILGGSATAEFTVELVATLRDQLI
jgi:hypothetical protein